jgi:sensor histidine kinase YesM
VEGDPKSHEIPPVILVPFVENAFKYGTSAHDQALIRIDIRLIGGILKFMVSNQIFTARLQPETFGIGIRNTRQRLQLIYPGRHTLEIEKTDSHFIVNMTINFS